MTQDFTSPIDPPSPSRSRRRLWLRVGITVVLLIVVVIAGIVYYISELLNKETIPLGEPSGELTFQTNRNGNWDIYLLDAEGGLHNLTPVNEEGDDDYFPSWAFQSDRVNFLTDRSGEIGAGQINPDDVENINVMSETEAIQSTIGTGRLDWDPQWSSDGDIVYFATLRDLALEIYVMTDNDTENVVRLTDTALLTRNWFMSLSLDGTRLAFSSDREGDENIYTMNVDGTDLVQLTTDDADDLKAVWSLDGTQLLFVNDADEGLIAGEPALYVMNADGSDLHPLGEDEVFEGNGLFNADGTEIMYMSNEEGFWNIYVMDVDRENVRRVTDNEADHMFAVWRPVPLDEDAVDDEANEESDE